MSDDIVTRLRECFDLKQGDFRDLLKAADEIERLRKALALAIGEVSTYGPYVDRSPEQLYEFFLWTVSNE